MPCAQKLYAYGEGLDLRIGTWLHSGTSGSTADDVTTFTRVGVEYNHRPKLYADWLVDPRNAGDPMDGQDPYNGYNASGVTARDFFQHVLPEGILAAYFGVRLMLPALPFDGNTPSSVDWLEIGYIPRRNWGPTLVSLDSNQAVT
jgi:hypothetical protein